MQNKVVYKDSQPQVENYLYGELAKYNTSMIRPDQSFILSTKNSDQITFSFQKSSCGSFTINSAGNVADKDALLHIAAVCVELAKVIP